MRTSSLAVTLLTLLGVGYSAAAQASERRFTYTYETGVLAPGERELEPWTTVRAGRDQFYARFDERLEFEVGLTESLQTAFYINFSSITAGPQRLSEFEFEGVSSEWKLKLADPVADPLGVGLYFEVTGAPHEAELEAKLLLDKRSGGVLTAFNLVGEYELEFEPGELETEIVIEADFGVAYFLTPTLTLGLEARSHNEIVEGELEHSVLFAGPVLSYSQPTWWAAFTVMPQLRNLAGGHAGHGSLDLAEHERLNARLIFGWHI